MRLAVATQTSQIYTLGPATSFDTSAEVFPQKQHASRVRKNIVTPPKIKKSLLFLVVPSNVGLSDASFAFARSFCSSKPLRGS